MENCRARILRLQNRSSIIGLNGFVEETHAHSAVAIDDVVLYKFQCI
jgi:hypothetical protein